MDINVSELYCGMNGAMYFVEMDEYGGKGLGHNQAGAKYGTGYCDAQVRKSGLSLFEDFIIYDILLCPMRVSAQIEVICH